MTYIDPNDPDLRHPPTRVYDDGGASASNTTMWVVGALAMLAILGVLIYAIANTGPQTASNPPAATTTTGAGGTERPSQPVTPRPNPAPAAPAASQ